MFYEIGRWLQNHSINSDYCRLMADHNPGGVGCEWLLDKVVYGERSFWIHSLAINILKKSYPFRLHSMEKWCPLHILSKLEHCIPFLNLGIK